LGDKLILAGPAGPKSYTFYGGIIGISMVVLLPFIQLRWPTPTAFPWIIAESIIYLFGLYLMYSALEDFDVSKVAATMGAAMPIFVLGLTWVFLGERIIKPTNILALLLLILGSFIISIGKKMKPTKGFLKITLAASFVFALDYVITKIVFLQEPFLLAFFWMRIFTFLFSLFLLLSKKNRRIIFGKKSFANKKIMTILALTYAAGGAATLLQAFAISLTPPAFLPILNALRGIQYAFVFLITLFLSIFLPKILKEGISLRIVTQKIISIIFIASGLALLVL
jgi:drug/metabolite transporter (DMT)-like permease